MVEPENLVNGNDLRSVPKKREPSIFILTSQVLWKRRHVRPQTLFAQDVRAPDIFFRVKING
jgi:hypothetical protein